MALEDKNLACGACGKEFVFTIGEQEFYQTHGLQNEPKRCPDCRAARRRERQGNYSETRPMFNVTCASCGAETTVPFEPKNGRPVYCKECYLKVRSATQSVL